MTPYISNPVIDFFFGHAAVGENYARCLLTVFVLLSLLYTILHLWRAKREFYLLDEAVKIRQAKDVSSGKERDQEDVVESSRY
jgi:hypothetical protein